MKTLNVVLLQTEEAVKATAKLSSGEYGFLGIAIVIILAGFIWVVRWSVNNVKETREEAKNAAEKAIVAGEARLEKAEQRHREERDAVMVVVQKNADEYLKRLEAIYTEARVEARDLNGRWAATVEKNTQGFNELSTSIKLLKRD